jgi:hypothetical protein
MQVAERIEIQQCRIGRKKSNTPAPLARSHPSPVLTDVLSLPPQLPAATDVVGLPMISLS